MADWSRRNKERKYSYSNLYKQKLVGKPDEILVTNHLLMKQNKAFFELSRAERVKKLEENRHVFREVEELIPNYDVTGNGRSAFSYKDEVGNLYDVFYDANTMQEIPNSAFSYPQEHFRFIGLPGVGKSVKCLSLRRTLNMISNHLDGFSYEYDYAPDSYEKRKIKEAIEKFEGGHLPNRNQLGEELEMIPIRLNYQGDSCLLECATEPGEVFSNLNWNNGIFENENITSVFEIDTGEYLKLKNGDTSNGIMDMFERYVFYGLRNGGVKPGQRLPIVFTKADLFKDEENEHIQNVLRENTIERDKNNVLVLKDKGILDLDKFERMQKEMFAYIRETCTQLYNKLQELSEYYDVDIFVTADLNMEPDGMEYNPESIVPFRTDEFWLYYLYLKGMVKAKSKNGAGQEAYADEYAERYSGKMKSFINNFMKGVL